MNYSVLRNRPELRFSMETVLLFPFYRTWCLLFRLYALLRNVIMYSAWVRKFIRISTREQDMHDIPPVCTSARVTSLPASRILPFVNHLREPCACRVRATSPRAALPPAAAALHPCLLPLCTCVWCPEPSVATGAVRD